ncbi:MAG: glycosyltransferase [Tannerella sp.]|jgi:glycosyltransferase involved in cell wall biosynthesis|nr:glycosyltransferase [Tannerella sp.]
MIEPDYIFECSWEVCNKVGGIYTVLSSRAHTLTAKYGDKLVYIGPDLGNNPVDFKADEGLFADWKATLPLNLRVRTGRWRAPGKPVVALVDFKTFFDKRDSLYYEMWEKFGVDSSHAYGDYDESCIFAYAAGIVIENFYNYYKLENKNVIALFNEWMLGMGALYTRLHVPKIATMFITHATTTGRSIACNNKPLYSHLDAYNGDQMARELNVLAKHSLEKQTAMFADCFATVSEITAEECRRLLGKAPDNIVPNGFESGFVPEAGAAYDTARREARKRLSQVVAALTGNEVAEDAFFVCTSGRYEYRNKGIDVFIDAINKLRGADLEREIVAFIMIPAWVYAPRDDLKYMLVTEPVKAKNAGVANEAGLQTPFITHWLHNMQSDTIINYILSLGFTNKFPDNLRIIFAPCYLDSRDGIFNLSYYDLLTGMDATVFASYYEPWGYTPLESVAFGVPTITTDLAGFGIWAKSQLSGNDVSEGVAVIHRTDDNYFDVTDAVSANIRYLMKISSKADVRDAIRRNCFRIAEKAQWKHFITYYQSAFNNAFEYSINRTKK